MLRCSLLGHQAGTGPNSGMTAYPRKALRRRVAARTNLMGAKQQISIYWLTLIWIFILKIAIKDIYFELCLHSFSTNWLTTKVTKIRPPSLTKVMQICILKIKYVMLGSRWLDTLSPSINRYNDRKTDWMCMMKPFKWTTNSGRHIWACPSVHPDLAASMASFRGLAKQSKNWQNCVSLCLPGYMGLG